MGGKVRKRPVVCSRCDDTHRMTLGDRVVSCTACPTPCDGCRYEGRGAYCATTPCDCACHKGSDDGVVSDNEKVAALIRSKLDPVHKGHTLLALQNILDGAAMRWFCLECDEVVRIELSEVSDS